MNYGLVPLGNVIPLFGAIPHGLIAQSWFMALRLNMAFFFLDLITGHKFAESVTGSIKNAFLASIYFTPIFLLPWTSIIGLIYEACALILSWPASYLSTSISYDIIIEAIQTSPPLIKNIFIWSTPIAAIILAATLNIISFSFYSTIYLKMKHGNQKFFFGKLK